MRRRVQSAAVPFLLGAWFLAGCDISREPAQTVTHDSSGVLIVDNPDSAAAWSVRHQLTIGVESGDLPYQLDQVQDVLRLPDGRILVVNGGSADLRFFGPDGTHLETVGRSGAGPGEYRRPMSVHRYGDTLVVWDFPRTTLLTTSGELIETHGDDRMRFVLTIQSHGMPLGIERLADGSYIMRVLPNAEQPSLGEYRPEIGVAWMSRNLDRSHLIGTFPDVRHVNVGTTLEPMGMSVPMSAHVIYAAGGDPLRVYVSWSDQFEILEHATDGQLMRIIRRRHEAVPVSTEALAAVNDQRRSSLLRSLPESEVDRRLNLIPEPESYPALDALHVDERGWLWARHYLTPSDTSARFSVFDATGTLRSEIEIPSRFDPFEATAEYVLGVSRDELNVERVELYAIVR